MTVGLLNPMPGHPVTQPFAGIYHDANGKGEPKQYLRFSNGKPWYCKPNPFSGGVYRRWCHRGVDIACPVGTPIRAPERMKIVLAMTDPYSGDHVIVGEIQKGSWQEFSHTSKILVPVGTIVDRGEHFALSGASGHVTGPHLHWMTLHTTALHPDPKDYYKVAAHDPMRCLVGADKAGRPWLVPTH